MAITTPRRARSALGNTIKSCPGDHEAITEARVDLKAANLKQHIRETVSTWPPLPDAIRNELAVLLLTPAGGGDAG
jgi:hypothetical protein